MKLILATCILLAATLALSQTNTCQDLPYSGVGLVVAACPNLEVMRVAKHSPGDMAGIHSFDRIDRIDNRDTKGMDLTEAVALLKGSEGSRVTLVVISITNGASREVTLVRKQFTKPSELMWKNEVWITDQIPGSTNVRYRIEERTDAQTIILPEPTMDSSTQRTPAEAAPMNEQEREYYKDQTKDKGLYDAPR